MSARNLKSRKNCPTSMSSKSPRSPTDIDRIIAKNICLIRNARGTSQEALAKQLGVSFQQIQKYENGKNRIAASRLYLMAQLLEVQISDFFPESPATFKPFSQDYLTKENIDILGLLHELPDTERKEIAKNVLKALRI